MLVGSSKQDSVTVTNTGTAALTITSVTSNNADFTVAPASGSLAPSASQKFYITFSPTSTGAKSGDVIFSHNAAGSADTVSVSGTGVAPVFSVSPTNLSYGNVLVGSSKQDSVTVYNTGTATLTISSVTSSDTSFAVTPTFASIVASDSAKFYITFMPSSTGANSGNVIFTHDGPGSPDSVKVNGNGIVNVADDTDGIPKTYALKQNYPNPFNPITVLKYQLPVTSNVMFKIYNILGQEVKTLTDEIQDAGYKSIEWNSTNNSGNIVASGVYFYRIEATSVSDPSKSFTQIRKMLLIR
ncbi:MAG: choice-of-anchor D domain-containing protein [Bacteroidetes bacterium]|nr:choice-of-anchor D domain-containing protein [Bacteroidota bacterium]MBU1422662.1 choice-of-anchor D domain-containing protein [Bacteroidota bacterium]MBU2636957.1 choice-of-anchor D domain-containing protein [Bacteroidota bacterium]